MVGQATTRALRIRRVGLWRHPVPGHSAQSRKMPQPFVLKPIPVRKLCHFREYACAAVAPDLSRPWTRLVPEPVVGRRSSSAWRKSPDGAPFETSAGIAVAMPMLPPGRFKPFRMGRAGGITPIIPTKAYDAFDCATQHRTMSYPVFPPHGSHATLALRSYAVGDRPPIRGNRRKSENRHQCGREGRFFHAAIVAMEARLALAERKPAASPGVRVIGRLSTVCRHVIRRLVPSAGRKVEETGD